MYIRYLKEESNEEVRAVSPGVYANTTEVLIAYIPNSITPSFTRFKIRIALGTDSAHVGPYVPPIKDVVYGELIISSGATFLKYIVAPLIFTMSCTLQISTTQVVACVKIGRQLL